MSAGTITLTNNSDAVAGAGTAFLTDLAAGDFIVANVGGVPYTLPVKAVVSDTALTLTSKFTGPTMSGLSWSVATRDQQSMITAALVAQITEALRGLNYDKQNWQAVFSAAGDITVTLPDGSQFPGPSWQKIATLLEESDLEAIQPLAEQVRDDAQQVAADKTTASDAATTAVNAAGAAANSASAADGAKTAAEDSASTASSKADSASASADAAEDAAQRASDSAGTIDITAFLRKDGNLTGLADKGAARTELDVYSRTEVDEAISGITVDAYTKTESDARFPAIARVTALESRLGYALIDAIRPGNAYLPLGTRTVFANPFGINVPVFCLAEFLHPSLNKWVTSSWLSTTTPSQYGINAWYNEGEGIVARTGANGYAAAGNLTGANNEFSANVTTVGAVRIHVWKVTA